MKKFIIALVTVVFIAVTTMAQTEQVVIKNGDNVTVYNIKDLGENAYGNKDARIDVYNFTNPAVRDLRAYEVPEEAWKMCSMHENGVYSSRVSKLTQALQEVKVDYENEVENTDYLETEIAWHQAWHVAMVILLAIGMIIIINRQSEIKKLKRNQK